MTVTPQPAVAADSGSGEGGPVLAPVAKARLVLGLQEWFRTLSVGNMAVAMRTSSVDCTAESPVRERPEGQRVRVILRGS